MAYDLSMAKLFREGLKSSGEVQEKNMFGSLGFMVNGKLVVSVGSDSVLYRLNEKDAEELIREKIADQAIMGKRTMKNWVRISNDIIVRNDNFALYLKRALRCEA